MNHLVVAQYYVFIIFFRLMFYDEEAELLHVDSSRVFEHSHCLLSISLSLMTERELLLSTGATSGQLVLLSLSLDALRTAFDAAAAASSPSILTAHFSSPKRVISASPRYHALGISGLRAATRVLMTTNCHQSGINAILPRRSSPDTLTIFSGGDDNTLVITLLNVELETVLLVQRYSRQHSAQITGRCVLLSSIYRPSIYSTSSVIPVSHSMGSGRDSLRVGDRGPVNIILGIRAMTLSPLSRKPVLTYVAR